MSIKIETDTVGLDVANVAAVHLGPITEIEQPMGGVSHYRMLHIKTEDGQSVCLTLSAEFPESIAIDGDCHEA